MNQSRPRRLCREGAGGGAGGTGSDTAVAMLSPSIGRSRRSPSIRLVEWVERANRISLQLSLMVELPRLQVAGRAEHDDRRILLVFGRRRHLLLGQFERDAVALVGNAPEMQ